MAFDNKKQLLIIVGAVLLGLIAVVLVSNFVKTTIHDQTQILAEEYDAKQKKAVDELQQRHEQEMAALAQHMEDDKRQEEQDMKRELAQMQTEVLSARNQPGAPAKMLVRKPSLALKTPVGKRAVTVKIDSLAAVGGLINAGDMVDVIAELKVPAQDADNKTVTAMIFQDLQVLAVNTNEDDPGAYDEQQAAPSLKITFAVDPQEAGLLAFADKNGTLELALRSPEDTDHLNVKADTWKTLADYVMKNQGLDIENPDQLPEDKQPDEVKPSIQIFRGGKEL